MVSTKQWVVLLEQQYATVSGQTGPDLLLGTRKFIEYLENDPQSQRYIREMGNSWLVKLENWMSNCHEIRQELQILQQEIKEVGARVQKYVDSTHEIPDQNAFNQSKHILERIQETNWYQSWADKTDSLDLELLHIERPGQTQTGYMVAHVLSVIKTLNRLTSALKTEQRSSRELRQQVESLWRKYGAAQSKVKNDWMSSGKCALKQLRIIAKIMDGDVFINPNIFELSDVRPFIPWALLIVMYAPPDLQSKAKNLLKQPDTTNLNFEKDIEPLIGSYLRVVFTELQFLANSRLAHQSLVERYKARCENYDWKNIAGMVQRYTEKRALSADESGKHIRLEYEDLLTLHLARYLHDNGYAVHYTPRDGIHEPDLLGNLANELEPIVVEAKVVGQRYGAKQGAPWIIKGARALLAYLEKYNDEYGVKDGYLIVFRLGDETSQMFTFDEEEWVVGSFTILPKIINIGQINKKDVPILIKGEDFIRNFSEQ